MSASGLRKDNWSHEQDTLIMEVVLDHAREGLKLGDAFTLLAQESGVLRGRTKSAIQNRWYGYLKNRVKADQLIIGDIINTPDPTISLTMENCIRLLSCLHISKENADLVNKALRRLLEDEGS